MAGQQPFNKLIDTSSVADPDLHGSVIKCLPWIRIWIRIRDTDSGSDRYKNQRKYRKKAHIN